MNSKKICFIFLRLAFHAKYEKRLCGYKQTWKQGGLWKTNNFWN